MLRAPGKFEQYHESDTDNYERLYLTHEDLADSTHKTRFVIKHPQNSHMSTVAMLERSYRLEYIDQYGTPANVAGAGINTRGTINQPGFALQNIIKQFKTNFGGTVHTDYPSKYLPWYSRLYSKSLESCVRKSGRNFANYHGNQNFNYDTTHERSIRLDEVQLETIRQQGTIAFPTLVGNYRWNYFEGAPANPAGISLANALDLIQNWRPDLDNENTLMAPFNTIWNGGFVTGATATARYASVVTLTTEYAVLTAIGQPSAAQTARIAEILPFMTALTTLEDAVNTHTPKICYDAVTAFWQGILTEPNQPVRISAGGSFADGDLVTYTHAEMTAILKNCSFLKQVNDPSSNNPDYSGNRNIFEYYWNQDSVLQNVDKVYDYDTAQLAIVSAPGVTTNQRQVVLTMGALTGTLPRAARKVLIDCGLDVSPPDAGKVAVRNAVLAGADPAVYTALGPFFLFCTDMYNAWDAVQRRSVDPNATVVVHDNMAAWETEHLNHYVVRFREPLVVGPHKPKLGPMPGCWSNTGDVLPRCHEETSYDIDWLADNRLFAAEHLNWTLVPNSTKLHTMHYRGDFFHLYKHHELRMPMHDVVVEDLGDSKFAEIEVRSTHGPPVHIMFYTRFVGPVSKDIETLNMAHNIKMLKLKVDSASETVWQDNIDHVTATRFPEYVAQHDWYRGNMLCIPFNSLPRGNTINATKRIEIWWELETTMADDGTADLTNHLFCALIYKDKFVTMKKHVQQSGWM